MTTRVTWGTTGDLFDRQTGIWRLAAENYATLDDALYEVEEILFNKCFWTAGKFVVSYRKASASSDPKAALEGKRECFLCKENRPPQQESVRWNGYEILVNPYPLTIPHFTIVSETHEPQLIKGHILDLVKVTRIFDESCVFYNGPFCGASAPDHLHFQAVDKYCFNNILQGYKFADEIYRNGRSRILVPYSNMYAAPYVLIYTDTDSELPPLFDKVMSALPPADPEPMMNIVAAKIKEGTLMAIFPRRRHRPECYGTGEGEYLISPASIEMLGTFPCAGKKEFDYFDESTIQKIYDDVCVTPEELLEIIEKIRK